MIRFIIYSMTLLFTILTSAQVSENRNITNFSKIKVATGVDLIFTQDANFSVKVEADDTEMLQYIKTNLTGNTLEIFVDSKNFNKKDKKNKNKYKNKILKVWVAAPSVDSFQASSSSSVYIKNGIEVKNATIEVSSSASFMGNIKADEINVQVSSSGVLKGDVLAKKLNAEVSSSGEIVLSGKSENTNVSASSSASFQGKDLMVKTAAIEVSSSAEATLTVTESLKGEATSSGSIVYYGNPKNVESDKNSSGSITKK